MSKIEKAELCAQVDSPKKLDLQYSKVFGNLSKNMNNVKLNEFFEVKNYNSTTFTGNKESYTNEKIHLNAITSTAILDFLHNVLVREWRFRYKYRYANE